MKTVRFLQFSDLHLGAPMAGSRLGLSAEQLTIRQQEFRQAVRRIMTLAKAQQVDVVLAPGDLWDSESLHPELFHFWIDCLSELEGIPLVITPGNHDYYSQTSYYHTDFLVQQGLPAWPKNTVIFTQPTFETRMLPDRPDILVTGCAFQGNVQVDQRLLSTLAPLKTSPDTVQLVLFHGSRLDRPPEGPKMLTAPFSLPELTALNADYVAVGHYHKADAWTDDTGRIRGGYAGCPFGRGLDEPGEKGVWMGEITKSTEGTTVQLRWEPIDPRRLWPITVDLTHLTHWDAVTQQIQDTVAADPRGIGPQDLVWCQLTGYLAPSLTDGMATLAPRLATALGERFFYFHADPSRLVPDFDLAALQTEAAAHTAAGQFVRFIQGELDRTQDPEARRIVENALKYGLHALHNHDLSMMYES